MASDNWSIRMFEKREKMREMLKQKKLDLENMKRVYEIDINTFQLKSGKAGPNGKSGPNGVGQRIHGTERKLNNDKGVTTSTSGSDFIKEQPVENKPKKIIFNIEQI